MKRPWVWFEAGASWEKTRRLATCGIGRTTKGNLPPPFSAYTAFTLTEPRDLEILFDVIHSRLGGRNSHVIDFESGARRFGEIEDMLVRDQKVLDDPLYEPRWKATRDRLDSLEKDGREALRFLLLDGNSTDYFALAELKKTGFAGSHASILPGLQIVTNLVQKVPDQPPPQHGQDGYQVQWEIKPEFRPLVRRYFEERG